MTLQLDTITLALTILVNALLMVAALAVGVGFKTSSGLRALTFGLLLQALGFGLLIAAGSVWSRALASLGVMSMSATFSLLEIATARYTKSSYQAKFLAAPPLALGVVHWLVYDHPQAPLAISNLVFGVQGCALAYSLLRHAGQTPWRWLVGVTTVLNTGMLFARAGLVLFSHETYPAFTAPHPINLMGLMLVNASMVTGTIGFLLAHRDEAEKSLLRLANFDELTGLLNRRAWMEQARTLFESPARTPNDIVLFIDLDHFKAINDAKGHAVGDRVLTLLGEVLRNTLRRGDISGRLGGEEFGVVLVDCTQEAFAAIDRKLHASLTTRSVGELGFEVQFSAGAALRGSARSLEYLLAKADGIMYAAKQEGRNRTLASWNQQALEL